MLTHEAPAVAGTTARGHSTGNTASIADIGLPAHVLQLLGEEGIRDFHDWRALSRRSRNSIFGITSRMVAQIDAAAREVVR